MNKIILITGCSRGIGECVAHGLSARGWRVFATARRQEDVERLSSTGLNALQLNMTYSYNLQNALTAVLQQTEGTLDALFNNVGYGKVGAVEDVPRVTMQNQFETNLLGP